MQHDRGHPPRDYVYFRGKLFERCLICFRLCAKQDIYGSDEWEHSGSRQLAQSPLGSVPIDDITAVFRNYHSNPGMKQQGSGCPSFQTLRLHPLPCTPYQLEVGFSRQTQAASKAERLTRRRIS